MKSLLWKLFGSHSQARVARPTRRARQARLGLEALGDRLLPSVTPLGSITGVPSPRQYTDHQPKASDRTVAAAANGHFAVTWFAVAWTHRWENGTSGIGAMSATGTSPYSGSPYTSGIGAMSGTGTSPYSGSPYTSGTGAFPYSGSPYTSGIGIWGGFPYSGW